MRFPYISKKSFKTFQKIRFIWLSVQPTNKIDTAIYIYIYIYIYIHYITGARDPKQASNGPLKGPYEGGYMEKYEKYEK